MIGKILGDFEIKEEIGRGGMGQVYRAHQISLDRDVAIKILPGNLGEVEEFRERFDIEAKAVASLVHENILQMYSKGVTDDGVHYFAMEYVDGEDLGSMLKNGKTFSETEAVGIAVQICRGLEAAWRKNIIHRDIKPSNIILTKTGTAKIADFGLAKSLDATKKLTQTNMYMGTVAYISPEQGEGRTLDHRTDIYSLGIVLYQLLTGSVPFKAETPSSVIYKHVYEAPPAPRTINPSVSPEAEAVVLKAIAKKPEDRFQNAVEFREALEAVNNPQAEKKAATPKQAAALAAGLTTTPKEATAAKVNRQVPLLIIAVVVFLLLGGSGLYASIYGYRALLSKVFPPAAQEGSSAGTAPPSSADTSAPPAPGSGAYAPETTPPANTESHTQEMASIPREATAAKETGRDRPVHNEKSMPAEARNVPVEQPRPEKRAEKPTVLVVASGEPDIANIIESAIGKRLGKRSIPFAASGGQRQPKADVLIYVTISTMNAAPLQYYGHMSEQYASTISIKVVDAATKKMIASPRSKTVNYTTLNMQDNIEEAVEEMSADLPRKIETFWKG
ncbi:MAG: protein kinase [Nitrospiraceae bacterium]|nr:protein kinase [Nitrospiraceae bacterium]